MRLLSAPLLEVYGYCKLRVKATLIGPLSFSIAAAGRICWRMVWQPMSREIGSIVMFPRLQLRIGFGQLNESLVYGLITERIYHTGQSHLEVSSICVLRTINLMLRDEVSPDATDLQPIT